MGNHMKGCGCRHCREGMHTDGGGFIVQKLIRKMRRKTKESLKKGNEPEPCLPLQRTS
jgi:hypothetical protein